MAPEIHHLKKLLNRKNMINTAKMAEKNPLLKSILDGIAPSPKDLELAIDGCESEDLRTIKLYEKILAPNEIDEMKKRISDFYSELRESSNKKYQKT